MKLKVILFSVLLTILSLMLLLIASVEIFYNRSLETCKSTIKEYASFFSAEDFALGDAGARKFSEKINGLRVTFISADGQVTGESEVNAAKTNQSEKEEVAAAMEKGEGFSVRKSDTSVGEAVYYCIDLNVGYLRLATDFSSLWIIFKEVFMAVSGVLFICAVICLFAEWVWSVYVFNPIEKMVKEVTLGKKAFAEDAEIVPFAKVKKEKKNAVRTLESELKNQKKLNEKMLTFKNEFVANITHEMNTPLTSIKGFAELLKNVNIKEAQREKAVNTILKQSERLTALIETIINYNEIDFGDKSACDVNVSRIVFEILNGAEPDIEAKNITLFKEIDSEVVIRCTHEEVTQIAGNIIRNAIKYNKEGGKLTVSLKGGKVPVLTVEDTGIGISEADKERVFERFFTVDKSHGGKHGGFGLGLAVVKKLCGKWNFKVDLSSRLNEGTKITVSFGELTEKQ